VVFKSINLARGCKVANQVELHGWIARLNVLKNISDIQALNPGNRGRRLPDLLTS